MKKINKIICLVISVALTSSVLHFNANASEMDTDFGTILSNKDEIMMLQNLYT